MTANPLARRTRRSPLARREARWGYLFLSPWILGFLAFTLLPMIATWEIKALAGAHAGTEASAEAHDVAV